MSMISTITWVRRGVAKEVPEKVELDADDLAALMQEKKYVSGSMGVVLIALSMCEAYRRYV